MKRNSTHPSLLLICLLGGCADLTAPSGAAMTPSDGAAAPAAVQGKNPVPIDTSLAHQRAPTPPQAVAPSGERIRASHILIAYQGAMRSQVTRSKDEARKLADAVLARVRGGQDFAALARQHSDDPTAKQKGGDLGPFGRQGMVKPFADAAFALKPGDISSVVETDFGFHVIKRTE